MVEFDDLILEHIRDELLTDISNFTLLKQTLSSLEAVSEQYARVFNVDKVLTTYLMQRIHEISFNVYQEMRPGDIGRRLHSKGSPIKYDAQMVAHVLDWYQCPNCIEKIIKYIISLKRSPLVNRKVRSQRWRELFCTDHATHLYDTDRGPIKNWKTLKMKLVPNQEDQFEVVITLIVPYRRWRWC
jgi:hypothetical protein